jgi:hypothetical protein
MIYVLYAKNFIKSIYLSMPGCKKKSLLAYKSIEIYSLHL